MSDQVHVLGMAMLAASPYKNYGGGLRPPPQQWAGASGARLTDVDSIILDGEAASIAIPKTYA